MLSAKGGKLQQSSAPTSQLSAPPRQGRARAARWRSRTTTGSSRSAIRRSRRTDDGWRTRCRRASKKTTPTRSTRIVAAADGSAAPRRITHDGRSVASPQWTDDGLLQYSLNARVNSAVFVGGDAAARAACARPRDSRSHLMRRVHLLHPRAPAAPGVVSADGKSRALAKDLPRAPVPEMSGTDFEKRHAARFQGRTFDWMRFQQDGQDYPTADPRLRPAAEITVTAPDGSGARALTTLGLRPANVAWHPNGSTIAFTADENWRSEQLFESPDIYTVSTQGTVARLTNDGYVWSSLAYSPDGQYLLAERTFGTGMIIDQKLSHGGSDDLLLWPSGGGAAINLTEKWDLEPNGPRWSADGRHVYFTAEKGGTTHVFRVAARAGAPVEQVTTGDRRLGNVTFDKAMTRIAYTVGHLRQSFRRVDRPHRRHGRASPHRSARRRAIRDWHHEDRTHHLEERGRHGDRRLPDASVRIQQGRTDRIRSSCSITAARTRRWATASTSSSSTSRRTATSCSTPTSAAPPATVTRSSGPRGARGATRTARM